MPYVQSRALDFTDGDTFKRFTISDPNVTRASTIQTSVQRANVADEDDAGWMFHANVVSVSAGSFDVNVSCDVLGEAPINDECPNEQAVLTYEVQ